MVYKSGMVRCGMAVALSLRRFLHVLPNNCARSGGNKSGWCSSIPRRVDSVFIEGGGEMQAL